MKRRAGGQVDVGKRKEGCQHVAEKSEKSLGKKVLDTIQMVLSNQPEHDHLYI